MLAVILNIGRPNARIQGTKAQRSGPYLSLFSLFSIAYGIFVVPAESPAANAHQ